MGRDLPAQAGSSGQLELRLAGSFGVIRDGRELAPATVGSRKARTLLMLLTIERPGLVPVDRIIDALWPAQPPALAGQNVATLVSRLRLVLGTGVIEGGRAGYRLAAGPGVTVDLEVAAGLCDQAERKLTTAAAVALAAAERALAVLAADTALDDEPYAAWADPARDELRRLHRRARLLAAEAALATGDGRVAARHAEAAVAADPMDEAAHRWFMSATAATGEAARALAAYAALQRRLADELGTDPAPMTRDLHLAILRDQAADAPDRRAAVAAAPDGRQRQRGTTRAARPAPPDHDRADGAGRNPVAAPLLVGRDAELEQLRAAWRAAVAGQSQLIMIVGEAGIGKTALAGALADEVAGDGATVLSAR